MPITIEALSPSDLKPFPQTLTFGKSFSNRMFTQAWTAEQGWHDAKIGPYRPFTLDPSTAVFHYAQEIFEGLKAYRHADDSIWAFRPQANAERFQRSAQRLALPELPVDEFVRSLEVLVDLDREWVPGGGEAISM